MSRPVNYHRFSYSEYLAELDILEDMTKEGLITPKEYSVAVKLVRRESLSATDAAEYAKALTNLETN